MFQVLLAATSIVVGLIIFGSAMTLIPFLLAWNYISPLFNLPYLDWIQAFAVLIVVWSIGSGFRSTNTSSK